MQRTAYFRGTGYKAEQTCRTPAPDMHSSWNGIVIDRTIQ